MLNKHRHTHVLFATVSGWLVGWFHAAKYNTYYLCVCTHKTISIVNNKRYEEQERCKEKNPRQAGKKLNEMTEKTVFRAQNARKQTFQPFFRSIRISIFDESVRGNLRNKILYIHITYSMFQAIKKATNTNNKQL